MRIGVDVEQAGPELTFYLDDPDVAPPDAHGAGGTDRIVPLRQGKYRVVPQDRVTSLRRDAQLQPSERFDHIAWIGLTPHHAFTLDIQNRSGARVIHPLRRRRFKADA